MSKVTKALAICGLAISAGPLSLGAQAQGYIDVEAERAAVNGPSNTSTPAPINSNDSSTSGTISGSDPYAPAAKTYPAATSYGLNSNPAPAQPLPTVAPVSANTSSGGGEQNLGNLFYQLQLLQQEVMTLNGKVEEQAHELRQLREQNLERYVDVDRRLSELSGGETTAAPVSSTGGSTGVVTGGALSGSNSSVSELPGEGDAYRAAYALVRNQQFDQAVTAFKQFLQDYPAGKYAPNAHYWLGELYLVINPVDLESSRQAFMLLLDQYPQNSKIPDALYKLGKVQFLKGNRDRAKDFFDRVISEYGSSNSSAVKLAKEFLRENY